MKNKRLFFYLIILVFLLALAVSCKPNKYKICHPNCNTPKVTHITKNIYKIEGWPDCILYYVDGEGYVPCYDYEISMTR